MPGCDWRPTFWILRRIRRPAHPAGPCCDSPASLSPWLEEALWFFQTDDPAAISADHQQPDVVVTDGAAPLRWCIEADSGVQVVSPSLWTPGSRDAFTAGLLHAWSQPVAERLRFAAACGALVCGGAGAIDPQPSQREVESFLGARQRS